MDCRDARQLIDGYVDGQVDLVRSIEIERHMEDCGTCLQTLKSRREVRDAVRSASLRFEAPRGLESRVIAAARAESRKNTSPLPADWRRARLFTVPALGLATVVVAVLLVWNFAHPFGAAHGQGALTEELVSSHVRSLMAAHLYDVASTDQHTVKPWFTGKLDYSPSVVDLKTQGYPLAGGRLDYVDGRPVAALVYTHRRHVINLFAWPDSTGTAGTGALRTETLRGFHVVEWTSARTTFHAVSDVNADDLAAFAKAIARATGT